MKSTSDGVLSQDARAILREIFVASWGLSLGPEKKWFRIAHKDHFDLLDQLELSGYVVVDHDHYYVHLLVLPEIMGSTPQARGCLDICRRVFHFLQDRYQENADERVSIEEIAELTRVHRDFVIKAIRYIGQVPVLASWTTNPYEDGASVAPAERILRYGGFDEAIEDVRSWTAKRPISPSQDASPLIGGHESVAEISWLLHPAITEASLGLFENGHLREAVLNSIMAVFDLIRSRTGLHEDGDALVGKAFSLERPHLIFTELKTDSGKNDQKGFMRILQGAYQGIRSPKAHRLGHQLTKPNAAQYLVFASLLARIIDEAKLVSREGS